MELEFNADQWIKSINIWDDKYDYVMHNDHWLTANWCSDCEKCRALTLRNDDNKEAVARQQLPPQQQPLPPQPTTPPGPIIPMTPIAPSHISTRAFVTPHTSTKFNDTYTRSTRQSTRKLLNQANQDLLINLNETFDLYKSARAETPVTEQSMHSNDHKRPLLLDLEQTTTNGSSSGETVNMLTSPTSTISNRLVGSEEIIMFASKPRSNFELLTDNQNNVNNDFNPVSLQTIDNHEYIQPVTSRIPRIPVRSSRNHDY